MISHRMTPGTIGLAGEMPLKEEFVAPDGDKCRDADVVFIQLRLRRPGA